MKRLTLPPKMPGWNASLWATVLLVALILAFDSAAMADSQQPASQSERAVLPQAPPQPATNAASPESLYQMDRYSINAAGAINDSSPSYSLSLSAGESVVGTATSASYQIGTGFWPEPAGPLCVAKPGDANASGAVNLADIIAVVNYVFKGGAAPSPLCRGDANASVNVNLSDIIYLVNYVFKGGAAPIKSDVCCL